MALVLVGLAAALALAAAIVVGNFLNLWLRIKASGVPIALLDLVMMRLRRVNPELVANSMIALTKAGVHVDVGDLEAHVLAGGHLADVTDAMISAEKAGLDMDFYRLAAIDLAGRNVVEALSNLVNPKVIVCPAPSSPNPVIAGVCQDGVRLGVKARVTVRTNLARLVGGAGAETVAARVGEGIVAAIGRAASHREVLEKPELISEYLLAQGLDSGTSLEVLSVDVADVDVRDNVGARLQSAQAEADKDVARAKAESRRAAAEAARREMQARTVAARAEVVGARANVPFGLSAAFWEGNLGRVGKLRPTLNGRMRWKWGRG